MTAAPGWGADCGGLTPGPVFPAIILWALGFTEVPGDWGRGADGTGRAEKVTGGERIVPILPWNGGAVRVLLYFAGTARIILLHPEWFGLHGHFDL